MTAEKKDKIVPIQAHTKHMRKQTEWIRLGDMRVIWAEAQREVRDERKVRRIMANFDPAKFGVLHVCRVPGMTFYHLIDGDHRREAAIRLYGPEETVLCEVHIDVTTPAQAADRFLALNSGTKPRATDIFRASVAAGDATACDVNDVLERCGLRISYDNSANAVRCAAACLQAAERYGADTLELVLFALRTCWRGARGSYEAPLIAGWTMFFKYYQGRFDRDRLIHQVSKTWSPTGLIGAARATREVHRNLAEAVVAQLLGVYNKGLRDPLPPMVRRGARQ